MAEVKDGMVFRPPFTFSHNDCLLLNVTLLLVLLTPNGGVVRATASI